MERDGILPELLRIRRLASHLAIPPWTIKIHCQGVHSEGSASGDAYTLDPSNAWFKACDPSKATIVCTMAKP